MTQKELRLLLEGKPYFLIYKDLVCILIGNYVKFPLIEFLGPNNFHISEKLNTAYSAIAFQLGCPYIEHINRM